MPTNVILPGDDLPAETESSKSKRTVDLATIPCVPFAWLDECEYAAIRGCSLKTVQRERTQNIGCPYKKINGRTIRYKLADITAFLESQPGGGGNAPTAKRGPGRPRKAAV
jgi:hypothetical protein